ncbi:hypothetical protein, partial [Gluconacetobacter azotocaptans]|uniref:hypothetical protein n=1 Tax=Gluconacetobacter azotocaptans TaxID=142834 RepID=UPI00222E3AFA
MKDGPLSSYGRSAGAGSPWPGHHADDWRNGGFPGVGQAMVAFFGFYASSVLTVVWVGCRSLFTAG